jgi:hypothetical protein
MAGAQMNLRLGLFRLWTVSSFIWVVIVGALAYIEITRPHAFPREYYYVLQPKIKSAAPDWTKPFYATNFEPGQGPEKETFSIFDSSLKKEWQENGRLSASTAIQFEDGTLLYIPSEIVKTDGRKIGEFFLAQRWQRYFAYVWPWLVGFILPPVLLFLVGRALLWVLNGFLAPTR